MCMWGCMGWRTWVAELLLVVIINTSALTVRVAGTCEEVVIGGC